MYKNWYQYNFLKAITHKYENILLSHYQLIPLFFNKHPWAYKIPPPSPQPYTNYNQPLNDIPKPEGKLCWERGRHPLKLLPAVMGATLFLGGPVKVNYDKIPRSIFGLGKLQIVSECSEEVWPYCCQKCAPFETVLCSWYQKTGLKVALSTLWRHSNQVELMLWGPIFILETLKITAGRFNVCYWKVKHYLQTYIFNERCKTETDVGKSQENL